MCRDDSALPELLQELLAEHKGWHEVAALVRSALANLALQSEPAEAD